MADATNLIRLCTVVSVDDNTDGNRIKVRIEPRETFTDVKDLPYCVPLLPQMVHVKPKVDECVLVMTGVNGRDMTQRYYIGPVISQVSHMPNEPSEDAKRVSRTSTEKFDVAPTNDVDATNGALPKNEDIALMGRKNSDIILTEDDVRVRCGVKVVKPEKERGFVFNTANPAYLKLKYYEDGLNETTHSTATVVADKINLITNIGKDQCFDTRNPDELIDDETMQKILEKAHQLPYGDILCQFLTILREAFLTHTHPYSMMPPCQDPMYARVKEFKLDSILSDGIRIN